MEEQEGKWLLLEFGTTRDRYDSLKELVDDLVDDEDDLFREEFVAVIDNENDGFAVITIGGTEYLLPAGQAMQEVMPSEFDDEFDRYMETRPTRLLEELQDFFGMMEDDDAAYDLFVDQQGSQALQVARRIKSKKRRV